jgi:hypothetical protein
MAKSGTNVAGGDRLQAGINLPLYGRVGADASAQPYRFMEPRVNVEVSIYLFSQMLDFRVYWGSHSNNHTTRTR